MRALAIALSLFAASAQAAVYEAPSEDRSSFTVLDAAGAHLRTLSGSVLAPGGKWAMDPPPVGPGDYKLRLTVLGVAAPTDGVSARITDERGAIVYAGPALQARLHARRAAHLHVELVNTSTERLVVGNVALLSKKARAPIQIVLYVPDASAYFPEEFPHAPWAHFAPEGTFHSDVWASGDNTWAFTRSMFIRDVAGTPALRHLRGRAIPTAVIADNFYLMQYVDQRLFDFMWIRDVARNSDDEINRRALDFVRQHHDEDFFLYVHVLNDHDTGHTEANERRVIAAVEALRAAAPGAIFMLTPDHGAMRDHSWYAGGKRPRGQGWGLYSDTEHIPFLAMGPGIPRAARCARRWSMAAVRDALASVQPRDPRSLLDVLTCRGPETPLVVTEGFKDQIAVTDGRYHYIRYSTDVPFPAYSAVTGKLARDKFLKGEALYDDVADPHDTHSIAGEQQEELRKLRERAWHERVVRFGTHAPKRRLRLLWLSRTCTAPTDPVTVSSDVPIRLDGSDEAEAQGTLQELSIKMHAPFCFRDLTVELSAGAHHVEVSLPGSALFLGSGYLERRGHVALDGAGAFATLADWRGGWGDVFLRNRARPGLYLFIEDGEREGPSNRVAAKKGDSGVNASPEEVRRMMRSWGYMRESEVSNLQ